MKSQPVSLLIMMLLSGCMMGPDFHRPPAPAIQHYTPKAVMQSTTSTNVLAGDKQQFVINQDIPAQWWTVFHSKPLEKLITTALQHNPDIQTASAALKIARENFLAQRASLFPYVQGNVYPTRQLTAGTLASNLANNDYLYSLQTTQLSISYVPDVFGLNRRQLEAFKAYEETVFFQRQAIRLTIASNVAFTAINEASIRAQLVASKQSVAIATEQLTLMKQQQTLGQIGLQAIVAQEALLAQMQANIPILEKQLTQTRHSLNVLCGRFPNEFVAKPFTLASFHLPAHLPLDMPSKLLEQRPDIRAASAQLHMTSAQIGVAIANRLPNVNLSLYGGSNPLTLATLFASGTGYWGVGANIVGTLFDSGALRHKQQAAVAAFKASDALYRKVVLSAFQDVADTLTAIEWDAKALYIANQAQLAARNNLMIAQKQLKFGSGNYLALLNAQLVYQQTAINLAQSQAARLSDSVALFQALGGSLEKRT